VLLFFFFFQAEDGIRDGHVTGVQTCALPISPHRGASRRAAVRGQEVGASARAGAASSVAVAVGGVRAARAAGTGAAPCVTGAAQIGRASCRERVESSVGGGALEKKAIEGDGE